MSRFRLVILDNTKEQLDNPMAQQVLSHMIFAKQKNFLRTDPNYVVMDKHDMIGTHYLIYDVENFLEPKLIFAIRTTFLHRTREHRLETPLMSLLPHMGEALSKAFHDFVSQHPRMVDCNAWFVDPTYSKKNSGLNLSDLGYLMVVMHLMRMGYDNFVGCTNETYSASRWLETVGRMPPGLFFEHPAVKCTHRLILMENFNLAHFAKIYEQYETLVKETFEVLPEAGMSAPKFGDYVQQILSPYLKTHPAAEVAA